MRKILIVAAITVLSAGFAVPSQAQVIQDTVNGSQNGFDRGNAVAGPLGGLVGGAVGAGVGAATGAVGTATGVVGSIFGVPDDRPRFREYAVEQGRPSYAYDSTLQVGSVLPRRGVTLYPVPRQYHVSNRYRYAVVNDRTVIVDPRSRRVVDIIE